jgi:hypothetical protein
MIPAQPFQNPADEQIELLLRRVQTIAVVGLSPKPNRPSFGVARQMQRLGFRIIPVRPGISSALGETAYPDLASVPDKIDLVDVFRNPEHVPEVIDTFLTLNLPAVWLQEGVVNEGAAQRAQAQGRLVVMDRCLYKEYLRFFGPTPRDKI